MTYSTKDKLLNGMTDLVLRLSELFEKTWEMYEGSDLNLGRLVQYMAIYHAEISWLDFCLNFHYES